MRHNNCIGQQVRFANSCVWTTKNVSLTHSLDAEKHIILADRETYYNTIGNKLYGHKYMVYGTIKWY